MSQPNWDGLAGKPADVRDFFARILPLHEALQANGRATPIAIESGTFDVLHTRGHIGASAYSQSGFDFYGIPVRRYNAKGAA